MAIHQKDSGTSGVPTAQEAISSGSMADWLRSKGINPTIAISAGVQINEAGRNIAYPRLDYSGVQVGWKVREIDTDAVFSVPSGIPNRDTLPFTAREGRGCLVICEGETDALAAATHIDFLEDPHIIGIPGATSFVNEWAGFYAWADQVFLVPDADDAGSSMVQRVCGLLPRARVVTLPDGMDLCVVVTSNQSLGSFFKEAGLARVSVPLRRSSYTFRPAEGVDHEKLLDVVLRDTQLKQRGGEYVGLCPFHEEDTPSFMVNPRKNLFYCHGCRAGGDVLSYVMKRQDVSFREAKEIVNDMQ